MFSNAVTGQAAARNACMLVGGSLALFDGLAEQSEVEQYYVSNGYLLANYHK